MALEEGRGWVQGIIFVPDEWDMSEVQAELFLHFKKCLVLGEEGALPHIGERRAGNKRPNEKN